MEKILLCCHCGNVTPHKLLCDHKTRYLYDIVTGFNGEDEKIFEDFVFRLYSCGTCSGATLLTGFVSEFGTPTEPTRAYPTGAKLIPDSLYIFPGTKLIPKRIARDYEEIWPLRQRAPNAFVAQVRRLLEFVCIDKSAEGKDLFNKLKDLQTKGYLPGYYSEMGDLLREAGNIAAHADDTEINSWDAEFIDELFREIVNYVYISPAKLKELKRRVRNK